MRNAYLREWRRRKHELGPAAEEIVPPVPPEEDHPGEDDVDLPEIIPPEDQGAQGGGDQLSSSSPSSSDSSASDFRTRVLPKGDAKKRGVASATSPCRRRSWPELLLSTDGGNP